MHSRRDPGFSLVELMVVVAIVGLLAVMAVGVGGQTQSRSRMIASAYDIRAVFAEARMRAIRTGRYHKVCLFRDALPGNDVGLGRVLVFGCNSPGSSCPSTLICSDVADDNTSFNGTIADPSYLYPNLFLTNTGIVDRPAFGGACDPAANPTDWCAVGEDAIKLESRNRVSIAGFVSGGAFSPSNRFEVTYGPSGLVVPTSSSAPSAAVRVLNADYCLTNCGTPYTALAAGAQFQNRLDITYTFGGAVRLDRK